MYIIGENIHIISPRVKEAFAQQDLRFFQDLAVMQVEAGADMLDLNIGPQKKAGHEILPWLVKGVQEVVDVPLSLDTTNLAAIEEADRIAGEVRERVYQTTNCQYCTIHVDAVKAETASVADKKG